jgi:hypothetical protein
VAGATTDHHGNPRLGGPGDAHDAAGDAAHEPRIRGGEAIGRLIGEVGGVVEQAGHDVVILTRPSKQHAGSGARAGR